jgi:hypothetical protein
MGALPLPVLAEITAMLSMSGLKKSLTNHQHREYFLYGSVSNSPNKGKAAHGIRAINMTKTTLFQHDGFINRNTPFLKVKGH